ncbi:MAG: hypothetical protein ACREQV_14360, partial [Candidatus Binatia bacterium]
GRRLRRRAAENRRECCRRKQQAPNGGRVIGGERTKNEERSVLSLAVVVTGTWCRDHWTDQPKVEMGITRNRRFKDLDSRLRGNDA